MNLHRFRELAALVTCVILLHNIGFSTPPVILNVPTSATIEFGQKLSLTAKAYGTPPLTYTWKKNGIVLQTSSSPNYTVPYVSLSDGGLYSVEVSNAEGTATAAIANSVAPSETFTHFIRSDGALLGMGSNSNGQLGTGDKLPHSSPQLISTGASSVATGIFHTAFIKEDGYLWSVGGNGGGQLVDGTAVAERITPARAQQGVQQVTAGIGFTGFLTMTGSVGGSGIAQAGGLLKDIVQLAAGGDHLLFVNAAGTLSGVGDNRFGQLGITSGTNVTVPTVVAQNVLLAAGGTYSTFYLTIDNKLWGLGYNAGGQLGDGTTANRNTPTLISTNVVSVSAGLQHAAFLKNDKSLWTIGANTQGQLGDGTLQNRITPIKIADNVEIVACGRYNTFYVTSDGALYATGQNGSGQLGLGHTNSITRPTLVATGIKTRTTAACIVAVTDAAIALKGSAPTLTLQTGHAAFPPALSLRYSDNRIFRAPPNWEVEDTSIAAMQSDGTILALRSGTTQLIAKFGGKELARVPISVISSALTSPLARIEVTNLPSSLVISHSLDLAVRVHLDDGRVLDNPAGLVLSASDGRLTIDGRRITGARSGIARILVNAGNRSIEASLNVVAHERIEPIDSFLASPSPDARLRVPVVIINYLPTNNGIDIDTERAPAYWDLSPVTLARIKAEIVDKMRLTKFAYEEGTKFRGYNDVNAKPYVGIQVVGYYNFYEAPYWKRAGDSNLVSQVDYTTLFSAIGLQEFVDDLGVKEVWLNLRPVSPEYPVVRDQRIPSEHFVNAPESNMSSPTTGDISNSDRYEDDLPVYQRTYVVYGNNLHRTHAENIHNKGHQIERQLGHLDYLSGKIVDQVFWRYFVAHPFSGHPGGRAGDVHFPPNAMADYDWGNLTTVLSDIEDWKPSGGTQKGISASRWIDLRYSIPSPTTFSFDERDAQYKWLLFWFQSIPGDSSSIPYSSGVISNWWEVFYNWDSAIQENKRLWRPLVVLKAPSILAHPARGTAVVGGSASFSVSASGSPPLTYQWYKGAAAIENATGPTLVITGSTRAMSGSQYRCVVTNEAGTITSEAATLTVTPPPADFGTNEGSDLVLTDRTTGERQVRLMNGTTQTGTLALGTVGVEWSLNTGDFNADGKTDLLWQNTSNGDCYLWLMNGTTLTSSIFLGNLGTQWAVAGTGDLNADGKADILWSNTSTGDRYVWLMNGTALASSVHLGTLNPRWLIAGTGDFNADGQTDVVWQQIATGERLIWLMRGTTKVSQVSLGLVSTALRIAQVGDFNADGKPDLVWQNLVTGERLIWLMNGTDATSSVSLGTIGTDWIIGQNVVPTPSTRVASDFDGDGQSDLLWSNGSNGDRYFWLMSGIRVSSSVYLSNVAPTWTVVTGDFNSDGQSDLLWSSTANGDRYVWLMDGTRVSSSVYLGNVAPSWSVVAGDFNADGQSDLLWSSTANGDRYVWLMNGTRVSSSVFLGNVAPGWSVVTGDFNSDGQSDLLWSNGTNGDRYFWLMNGTVVTSSVFLGTVNPVWLVSTGDYNADGQSDLLWSNSTDGDRYVWLMDGTSVASDSFLSNVSGQWTVAQ